MGEITIRITGGAKPYDIELLGVPPTPDHPVSWTVNYDPPFNFILEDVKTGNYQVKVTDSNRCEDTSLGRIIVTNPCECETVMTVGEASYEDPMVIVKGYNIIESEETPLIGSLSPNCESVLSLLTISAEEGSFLSASQLIIPYSESYPSVKVVYVNDFPYYLYCLGAIQIGSSQFIGYYSADHLPLPDEEETCDIRICNEEVPECFDAILTVGEAPEVYPIGTMGYSNFLINFGELSPAHNISAIVISPVEEFTVLTVILFNDLSSACPTLTIEIDETEYELPLSSIEGFVIYMGAFPENPLPAIGETCSVRICIPECTTTTTTIIYCESPLCETALTVGTDGQGNYGFLRGFIGNIYPDCGSINAIGYFALSGGWIDVVFADNTYCDITLWIDSIEYQLGYVGYHPEYGGYVHGLQVGSNPLPSVGETCDVIICGIECTTTTTTTIEPTTTTTTSEPITTTTTTTEIIPEFYLGALYNWWAVIDDNGLAPDGYHIPSDAEWQTLFTYLTDNGYGYGGSGSDIAKSVSAQCCWNSSDTAGTVGNNLNENNLSCLSIVGSSMVYSGGGFSYGSPKESCRIWTSYDDGGRVLHAGSSHSVYFYYNSSTIPAILSDYKEIGASVRCIRDTDEGWTPSEKMVDYDGNEYDTVQIGTQIWTMQNLTTHHFKNGVALTYIPDQTTNNGIWITTDSCYCFHKNHPEYDGVQIIDCTLTTTTTTLP